MISLVIGLFSCVDMWDILHHLNSNVDKVMRILVSYIALTCCIEELTVSNRVQDKSNINLVWKQIELALEHKMSSYFASIFPFCTQYLLFWDVLLDLVLARSGSFMTTDRFTKFSRST